MSGEQVERRLAAILAADVTGYSRLMGADEEGTLAQLKALRNALIDPTIAAHRGRIVKTTGDGMLVEFASAVDAARGAADLQRAMAKQNINVPQDKRIELRIGIHVGDIIDENDIFGDGVNIAARLEGIAEPGGICISDDAQRQIRGKVELAFDDMGPQLERDVTAFARGSNRGLIVTSSGLAAVHRELIIGLAAQYRLPAVYSYRYFANSGGLVSYGPDPIDQYRRAAIYVDRILKGESPADLPVQAPTKYELVINLNTAKALGLILPQSMLARADEVIE